MGFIDLANVNEVESLNDDAHFLVENNGEIERLSKSDTIVQADWN